MNRSVLYPPALIATAILLTAAFVVIGLLLYRADALMIFPSTSPIPFVVVDPSVYLPEFISLTPLPTDGNLPVPRA